MAINFKTPKNLFSVPLSSNLEAVMTVYFVNSIPLKRRTKLDFRGLLCVAVAQKTIYLGTWAYFRMPNHRSIKE